MRFGSLEASGGNTRFSLDAGRPQTGEVLGGLAAGRTFGSIAIEDAGLLREPPEFLQRAGLQWLYRLAQEPGRLWKRYLLTNSQFIALFGLQIARLWRPDPDSSERPAVELRYG